MKKILILLLALSILLLGVSGASAQVAEGCPTCTNKTCDLDSSVCGLKACPCDTGGKCICPLHKDDKEAAGNSAKAKPVSDNAESADSDDADAEKAADNASDKKATKTTSEPSDKGEKSGSNVALPLVLGLVAVGGVAGFLLFRPKKKEG